MSRRDKRIVTFTRHADRLVRTVVMHDGRTYAHSCEVEVFQTVLHALYVAKTNRTRCKVLSSCRRL
jgi:hypothetical protein